MTRVIYECIYLLTQNNELFVNPRKINIIMYMSIHVSIYYRVEKD